MSAPFPAELPARYYLDYFEYVLDFVGRHYGALLQADERAFLATFRALPTDARCLFVRMTNRRHQFFRVAQWQYPEIEDLPAALDALLAVQLATRLGPAHAPEAADVLHIFTRTEVLALARQLLDDTKGWSSRKKPELVADLLAVASPEAVLAAVATQGAVVRAEQEAVVARLRFCFFGNLHDDMTQFVVRDLGAVRMPVFDEAQFVPWFTTRTEMEDKYWLATQYEVFRALRETHSAPDVYEWFVDWAPDRAALAATAHPLFDRLCQRLGQRLEKARAWAAALDVYDRSPLAPAPERSVRLLMRMGRADEALVRCDRLLAAPQNAEEQLFAHDCRARLLAQRDNAAAAKGARKRRVRNSTTDHLRAAETVVLDVRYQPCVEQGVIEHLRAQGGQALFSENYLWCSLFGLTFWEVIYNPEGAQFYQPFQRAPADFYSPDFFRRCEAELRRALRRLDNPDHFCQYLDGLIAAHHGTSVPLVGWHEQMPELLRRACQKVPASALGAVLLEMARDPRHHLRGFPDLLTWTDQAYEFVEVKSPNDQLSAQQLHWLRFFAAQDIPARVLRVAWSEAGD